jgi:hypothetical protein
MMSEKSLMAQFIVPNGKSAAVAFRDRQLAARELVGVLVTNHRDLAEIFVSGSLNSDPSQGNVQKASAIEIFYRSHEIDKGLFPEPRDLQAFMQLNLEEIRRLLNG